MNNDEWNVQNAKLTAGAVPTLVVEVQAELDAREPRKRRLRSRPALERTVRLLTDGEQTKSVAM